MSNPYDPTNPTALDHRIFEAVENGTLQDVKSAVEMGANPRQHNDELVFLVADNTPENQGPILAYLIDQGCDINTNNGALLKTAIKRHNNDLLETLLEDYDPDLNIMGRTSIDTDLTIGSPLTFALFSKNTAAVKWLIDRGVKHTDGDYSALKLACNLVYADGVKALLETGEYNLSRGQNEILFAAKLIRF